MLKEEIREQGNMHYQSFFQLYTEAMKEGSAGFVHQYRVSLKRFYALSRFLAVGIDESGKSRLMDMLSIIRPAYKRGGKLRDLQVMMSMCASFDVMMPPPMYSFLYKLYLKRVDKFLNEGGDIRLLSPEEFEPLFNSVAEYLAADIVSLQGFVNQNRDEAAKLMENAPGKSWHEARRLIKQNYLLMQMFSAYDVNRFSPAFMEQSSLMEQSLGTWHDMLNLLSRVSRFLLSHEMESVVVFRHHLSSKMAIKEEEIREMVSQI